jgi:hypothetical protein
MKVDPTSPDRRWAADLLGVPPDAPSAEARTVFLRRLPGSDFVPVPAWCAATADFLGRPVPGSIAAVPPDEGDEARSEVAEFAERFWTLPPAVRRGRWQELMDHTSADPLLSTRLRRLEAGLDLASAVGDSGPPRPREIAVMAQTLFVLDPIRRAARRREMLDNLPPPASGWELAARNVQHNYPGHAALDPALITRLSTGSRRVRPAARGISRPAATWGFQAQGGLHLPQSPPIFDRPPPKRRSPTWLAILLVLLAIRAVGGLTSSWRETVPSYPTDYRLRPKVAPWTPPPSFEPEKDAFEATRRLFGDDTARKLLEIGTKPPADPKAPAADKGPPP